MTSVLDTLSRVVTPFLVSKDAPKAKIDEWTFRVHYRLTSGLLFLFSGLICLKEYLGDHIKCVHMQEDDGDDPFIPRKLLETYCFIRTTFTVPYDAEKSLWRMDYQTAASLGGPGYVPGINERVYHAYYQWVPFYLFLLALLFALPHAIWKAMDNHKIQHLIQNLNVGGLGEGEKGSKSRQISLLSTYLVNSRSEHVGWGVTYVACELLNACCLGGCMYLTDLFLGRQFTTYGLDVLNFLEEDPEEREDPMSRVFPRVTKCNFNSYGPSGSVQRFDALCILPSNILNEKIFTFLWFWFLMVSVLTIFSLVYRLLSVLFPAVRLHILSRRGSTPKGGRSQISMCRVVAKMGVTDWILLTLIRLNVDEITFDELIESIDQLII